MASQKDSIPVLDSYNFDRIVLQDSSNIWFIMFHSTTCGPCREAKSDFQKVAEELKQTIQCGTIEGDSNESICKRFNVCGYPSFLLFGSNKLEPIEYIGSRKAADMIKFCVRAAKQLRGTVQ